MLKSVVICTAFVLAEVSFAAVAPRVLFEKIGQQVMDKDPNITEFEVCIESNCETFFQSDIPRKAGDGRPLQADPSQTVADAVGHIVGNAAKSIGVGGRVVVDYEKKADGSIKVRVEASFGTGSGAASAAGSSTSSNPDDPYSK
jgi:hypothetical protein